VIPHLEKPFTKIGLVEWLKVKALSSSPSTAKKKKKKKRKTRLSIYILKLPRPFKGQRVYLVNKQC
jgi:hypothetical protein